jgi:glycosyltransferase involved in cell wall biosynthesis
VPVAEVDARLDGFEPEVVLCVMQRSSYYEIAWNYARVRGLPLVVIVHDVNGEWESVFAFARPAQRSRDGAFYRYAARRLCISPEMEQLCAQLYGARGEVQYPNRSVALLPRPPKESLELKRPGCLTVGFVGNLNYGYGNELIRLLPAFRAAQARLVVFSQPPGGSAAALLEAKDCVDYRGFLPTPEEAWAATKRDCDAVILPYPNPAGTMEQLVRHHFPSKLPEYLALGMPVVVSGPKYATGVRWALQNPEAVAACIAPEPEALRQVLERLHLDASWRSTLATSGVLAGNSDFDPTKIKKNFLERLRVLAGRA